MVTPVTLRSSYTGLYPQTKRLLTFVFLSHVLSTSLAFCPCAAETNTGSYQSAEVECPGKPAAIIERRTTLDRFEFVEPGRIKEFLLVY